MFFLSLGCNAFSNVIINILSPPKKVMFFFSLLNCSSVSCSNNCPFKLNLDNVNTTLTATGSTATPFGTTGGRQTDQPYDFSVQDFE